MKNLVIFNGPPRSGKDTLAKYLREEFGGLILHFATPLKAHVHAAHDLAFHSSYFENNKDEPTPYFYGKTPRQAYIAGSWFMKELHGEDIYGKLMIRQIDKYAYANSLVIIPDAGFQGEIPPLIEEFGHKSILLIHLARQGFDWKNDSRSYIYADNINCFSIDNTNLKEGKERVKNLVKTLFYHGTAASSV